MKLLAITVAFCGAAFGQPAFEAASVNMIDASAPYARRTTDPGRIDYPKITMIELLEEAYGVKIDQVAGGPEWSRSLTGAPYYHVQATMAAGTSKEQARLMLENLLAERFHLAVHHETRNFPGYDLVVAKNGPKLKEAAPVPQISNEELTKLPPKDMIAALNATRPTTTTGAGTTRQKYPAESMADFAGALGDMVRLALGYDLGSPVPRVDDKTGLAGKYAFNLEFACAGCIGLNPNMMPLHQTPAAAPNSSNAPPTASEPAGGGLPTIFAALENQLGLKLEKSKDVPVDVIVIDRIEKTPSGN